MNVQMIEWIDEWRYSRAMVGPYQVAVLQQSLVKGNDTWTADCLLPSRPGRRWTVKTFDTLGEAREWIEVLTRQWFASVQQDAP